MYIYNPDNFHPEECLPKQLTAGLTKKLYDYSRLFLHILINVQVKRNCKESTPLKHRILQDTIHFTGWPQIRELLVDAKVIDCDYRCIKGEKCYWYTLGEKYRERPVNRIQLDNKELSKKHEFKEPELKSEAHKSIWHWLNQIEFDYEGAKETLLNTKAKNAGLKWLSIEKLKYKDYFFHTDERGRVYHNIANLWSEFRKHITINGQQLVNIDISNSQPLILAAKLKNDITDNTLLLNRAALSLNDLCADVELYIKLAEAGKIYDYLMVELGFNEAKRGWFKKKFFAEVLYAECNKNTKLAKKFTQLFPTVAAAICKYKEKDYTELPLQMQKVEADLMINGVCSQIDKSIPFITIHDSILTPLEHVQTVKNLIQSEFKKIGLSLTFGRH
jgi:hypothetical protein